MNKIYIGNMSYNTTENDLTSLFGQCGNVVSATVIKDRYTSRSKGFGFVEFDSNDSANAAVEKFNGYDLGGRQLRVNIATGKPEGGGGNFHRDNRRA